MPVPLEWQFPVHSALRTNLERQGAYWNANLLNGDSIDVHASQTLEASMPHDGI